MITNRSPIAHAPSLPLAAALALALAGDDGELRVAAQALLGEVDQARLAAPSLAAQLVRSLDELARAQRGEVEAEAAAAAPDARPEARHTVGLARAQRALARDALRDLVDPLPPP